jgi:hypothetical protein
MNRNQFSLLLFLVIVLGIAGLIVYNKQNDTAKTGDAAIGKKLLPSLAINDVAHIVLAQGTNHLNLAKKEGTWRVRERNDYPANYPQISEFLIKAGDLKIVQSEKVGPSQLGRLELVPGPGTNSAVEVDLKDANDKTSQTLLLGKKHMQKAQTPSPYGDMGENGYPDGRYVQVGGNSGVVDVISDALANVEPKPEQWLNKDFFKVDKVKAVSVDFLQTTNSWKLSRETETGDWKLADAKPGEQLDSGKTSSVSNPLSSPSFNDVDTVSKPEQLGLDKPTVVTLNTFENFTYTLKVGQKTNDNYPMLLAVAAQLPKDRTPVKDEKPEDKDKLDKQFKEQQKKLEDKLAQEQAFQNWTYLVSSWTLDPLLKNRAQLMVEKKEEPKKDDTKKEDKPAAGAAELPNSSETGASGGK